MGSTTEMPRKRLVCPACKSDLLATAFDRATWAKRFHGTPDVRHSFTEMMLADHRLAFRNMLQCKACGTLFTDHVPPPKALQAFYTAVYGDKVSTAKIGLKLSFERRRIFFLKFLVRGRRFLDIGCNVGCAVEAARRNGFSATGTDLNPKALELARQRFPANRFIGGSLEDLQDAGAYDLVFCAEVLEHVPEPADFLHRLGKLVAPGGILFLTTPDAGHASLGNDLIKWDNVKPPEHLTLFTRQGLARVLPAVFRPPFFFPNRRPGMQAVVRRASA